MNTNATYNEDCLVGMDRIPDKQIDLILCDLPQEITSNEWDKRLPLPELWTQYNRVIKEDGAIVLDSCMGSGSTIIAAINTDRQYIGFETDPVIFQKAEEWIYNGSR